MATSWGSFNKLIALTIALMLSLADSVYALTAEQTKELVADLYSASIKSHAALNAFYNYSANTGDKGLLADSLEAINDSNEILGKVQTTLKADQPEDVKLVENTFAKYKKLLDQNVKYVKKNGYADLRLQDDLARTNNELSGLLEQLTDKVVKSTDYVPNSEAQAARELAVTISKMVSIYTARSTSNVVQIAQGDNSEAPLDVKAKAVDKKLDDLLENGNIKGETKKDLMAAKTKWEFIRSSFINYNENNVNYVVNLYSKRIIQTLMKVSQEFADK